MNIRRRRRDPLARAVLAPLAVPPAPDCTCGCQRRGHVKQGEEWLWCRNPRHGCVRYRPIDTTPEAGDA